MIPLKTSTNNNCREYHKSDSRILLEFINDFLDFANYKLPLQIDKKLPHINFIIKEFTCPGGCSI